MKLVTFIFACILSFSVSAQNNPYLQAEPKGDNSLKTFKKQLTVAIEKRDTSLLKTLLADSVLESANGLCKYCTKAKFIIINCKENTQMPYSNDFWEQAERLVKLGFTKASENNPDYYANIVKKGEHLISPPYNYHNNLDSVLLLDTNIAVLEEPFETSKVLARMSLHPVPTVNDNTNDDSYSFYIFNQEEKKGYIRVKLFSGGIGYINENKTSQSIYKQITIAKIKGQWKIVSFYHPSGC